jgi:hypothetical protein
MNTQKFFGITLLIFASSFDCFAQTIDEERMTEDIIIHNSGPSERTASEMPSYKKRRRRKKQQPIEKKEQMIDQESALFGATQVDSESDNPEGFLRGESN